MEENPCFVVQAFYHDIMLFSIYALFVLLENIKKKNWSTENSYKNKAYFL